MTQVAAGAEKTIQRLCNKSLPHYQRDRAWRRLVRGGEGGATAGSSGAGSSGSGIINSLSPPLSGGGGSMVVDVDVSELEFEVLRALTYRRPLHAIDAQLAELHVLGALSGGTATGGVQSALFTHLVKVYYGRVRQFVFKQHKHLFISNPRDPDSMLHVIARLPLPSLAARALETRRITEPSGAEARAALLAPNGIPPAWLAGSGDSDSAGGSSTDSSPFKFVACRRLLTQLHNPHELDLIAHFTDTVTSFLWHHVL